MTGTFAIISADLRAKANYLPYCPLCSFVGITEFTDILRGPSHREHRAGVTVLHKLAHCCSLSAGMPPMETQAEAAAWWRTRRSESLASVAADNRRRSCLEKLAAKNLEAIE